MAEPPPSSPRADIARAIEQAKSANQQARAEINTPTSDDVDRSWIARRIITVFVGVISALLVLLVVQGYTSGKWADVANSAADLIKTAVLPIVTLVLGFYFGKSGKN